MTERGREEGGNKMERKQGVEYREGESKRCRVKGGWKEATKKKQQQQQMEEKRLKKK